MRKAVTQGERIVKIETDINHIKDTLHDHTTKEEKFQDFVGDMLRKIDDRFDKQDEKYAPKWVENAVLGGAGSIALLLIGAFITFIIKGGLA